MPSSRGPLSRRGPQGVRRAWRWLPGIGRNAPGAHCEGRMPLPQGTRMPPAPRGRWACGLGACGRVRPRSGERRVGGFVLGSKTACLAGGWGVPGKATGNVVVGVGSGGFGRRFAPLRLFGWGCGRCPTACRTKCLCVWEAGALGDVAGAGVCVAGRPVREGGSVGDVLRRAGRNVCVSGHAPGFRAAGRRRTAPRSVFSTASSKSPAADPLRRVPTARVQ